MYGKKTLVKNTEHVLLMLIFPQALKGKHLLQWISIVLNLKFVVICHQSTTVVSFFIDKQNNFFQLTLLNTSNCAE